MTDAERERKRIAMRSCRRGTKEMDMILSAYCDVRLATMAEAQRAAFESLLAQNDQDLYRWVSEQSRPPAQHEELIADIRSVVLSRAGGAGRMAASTKN